MSNNMAVIFDMDGVLVDSYSAHFESWKSSAARYGLTMTQPDFAATFGRTSRDIIRHLWPNKFDDAQIAAFDAAKESDYRDILRAKLPVMPGAEDLITALHQAGFALAIGSSGPKENVAVVVQGLKNGALITQTVNGSEVKHGKPDPQVFLISRPKTRNRFKELRRNRRCPRRRRSHPPRRNVLHRPAGHRPARSPCQTRPSHRRPSK